MTFTLPRIIQLLLSTCEARQRISLAVTTTADFLVCHNGIEILRCYKMEVKGCCS